MPRERSPHLKYARKREYVLSSETVKRTAPLQRPRSSSRSPSRKRFSSYRSISPCRDHGDEFSKYGDRRYGHTSRLPSKHSKMSMCRKDSLSPHKSRSPARKYHSSFQKSPVTKSLSSLCSTDDRNAQRMGENYRRDASSSLKRDYDRSRVDGRSPLPASRKRSIPMAPLRHGSSSSSDMRTKDFNHVRYADYNSEFHDGFYKRDDAHHDYSVREEQKLLEDGFEDGGNLRPYSAEELKKITVDIRRNIPRENDTIIRHIIDPDNVQLVRRADEGVRPIFERDEIKQGMMERSDEFAEKRVVAIVSGSRRSCSPDVSFSKHGSATGYHENFKVRREKYSSFDHNKIESRPRLSDRWQQDSRSSKFGLSQNEKVLFRDDDYELHGNDASSQRSPYRDSYLSSSSRTYDDNSRSMDYEMISRPLPANPNDLRHSLLSRGRPLEIMDARRRILERRERDDISPRRYMDSRDLDLTSNGRSRFQDDSLGFSSSWEHERFRNKWGGRGCTENLPNFAARPDRYQYKEWLDKPDMVPKGPSYFEHDTRDGDYQFSVRGRGRGFRGVFRGRGYYNRGNLESHRGRGQAQGRGVFVMRRRGKRSPNQWEHDLFEMSPEGKMNKFSQS